MMSADVVLQGDVPGGLATIFQHLNLMARPANLRFAGRAFRMTAGRAGTPVSLSVFCFGAILDVKLPRTLPELL
ncbi:hypothetical protein [Rhizobium leguminosarum]|uniref:hypothetical protein n=1 Tax=Rhizobium leguminosarum TaxID=384 RepID=UPI001C97B00F|nr:hypothetical protein [Rhizobium leguminosarum]